MEVKKNFGYNFILTVSNYIFPLITFPYVSRVLGVTKMGTCSFVDSIINYYILFAMMGISAVGIREIAGSNNNSQKQSKIFSSLFTLNAISTLVMLLLLLVSIEIIPQFSENRKLLYIGASKLIGNLFLVEWYFKGTENFKYITKRSIAVKTVYVLLVLLLVKEPEDYYIYFSLLTGMVVFNAFINFPYACSKVKLRFHELCMGQYIKPFLIMGSYMLLTSMYTSFNVVYLGMTSGDTEVGYYSTSAKLFHIILAVYTAFTGVMLPRMSALYSENRIDEFKKMIRKSTTALVTLSVPAVIMTTLLAPEIVYTISGPGYEGAYTPARIIMPLIFIIGYEQILVLQILMPTKKDKSVLRNSILGATVGVLLNILLVQRLGATGSAIVWVASEITVLLSAQYAASRMLSIHFPMKELIKNILYYTPSTALALIILKESNVHYIQNIIITGVIFLVNMTIVIYYTQPHLITALTDKIAKRR